MNQMATSTIDVERQHVDTYFLVQAESQIDMAGLISEMQKLAGVRTAERVTGPFDVIAEAEGGSEGRDSLSAAVSSIPGVIRVVTMPTVSGAGGSDAPRAA